MRGGGVGTSGRGGTAGLGGDVGKSLRGGTFGVVLAAGGTFPDTDLAVDALAVLVDLTVVVVTLATGFTVEVGRGVVVVVVVVVLSSLSFDLKNPVNPLKNPFFFVVVSGASVVVVVVVVRATGGKG